MPALPKKKLRRPTPTTNSLLHQENVWQRTLDSMRLGPLSSSEDIKSTDLPLTTSDLDLSMAGLAERKSERKPTLFLDLPLESQQEICGNVSCASLFTVDHVAWESSGVHIANHFNIGLLCRLDFPFPGLEALQRSGCQTVIQVISYRIP